MTDSSAIRRITTPEQVDELFEASRKAPVWLFKHSLICPTSTRAWDEFVEFVNGRTTSFETAVIEIQRAREASKAAEKRAEVRHESPQALLLVDGKVVWHDSHWNITTSALESASAAAQPVETAGR